MKNRRGILSIISKNKGLSRFEKDVYRAVYRIPKGEVRSYGWVAKTVGRPNAARAVGNALNKNPYPGPIPCHRVIKSDGTIGGFAKGLSLKRKLLKSEGVDCRGCC
jgi:methylated-DNA-[protein]-cysteine S-methyltransferase